MTGEGLDSSASRRERRISETRERQVSFMLPVVLDARIEDTVKRAHEVGDRTTRREVMCAILFQVEIPDDLREWLQSYRLATPADLPQSPEQ